MTQLQLTNEIMSEASLTDILRDPSVLDFFRNGARHFDYSVMVPAVDTDCVQMFQARHFVHHDWVDGQDMVQAGQTPDNDGFNFLFHNLEGDLDLAKADITTLFKCIAELRKQLATQSAEIKAELNRIDNDLWALTPNKTLVSKIPPQKYVGVTKINDVQMAVLQNADGSYMTLALQTELARPGNLAVLPSAATDRLDNAVSFGAFAASNPDLAAMFANNATPTLAQVDAKIGNATLDNGKRVSDVLAGISGTTVVRTPADLADAVSDHEAAVVRSSADAGAVRAAVGADASTGAVAGASLANVSAIDADTSAKLSAAGIKTVADLANADAGKLQQIAGSSAGAAKLKAVGRTLKGLG